VKTALDEAREDVLRWSDRALTAERRAARLVAVRDAAVLLAGLVSIAGDDDGERARFTEGDPAERVAAVRALWDALDG
jgi:hypothetical protein